MRFCLLTTFYPPWNFGGDGIQVQRLAHALADRGHRVTVVCAPAVHRLLGGGRVPDPEPHPNVEVVKLPDGPASLTATYLAGRPLRSRRGSSGCSEMASTCSTSTTRRCSARRRCSRWAAA